MFLDSYRSRDYLRLNWRNSFSIGRGYHFASRQVVECVFN